ncbi:helix-turn-helix domain-containing protein [Micromonospora sp. NPDC048999]|uniref:helix-turn-helix domain-containing protein n=1 Tax=Micromonospora sp. NPDC048999 TaxID=3155391 RepID=UPI0033FBC1EB
MHESATPRSDASESVSAGGAQSDPLAYSVPEAAQRIGMKERKVRQLVADGAIRSFKVGAARRVSHTALVEFIEKQEKSAA